MDKNELIATVAKKTNVTVETAQNIVNAAIVEAVSPLIFRKGGEVAGIGDTNGCRVSASPLEQQASKPAGLFGELTSEVQKEGRTVKVIVQGIEVKE